MTFVQTFRTYWDIKPSKVHKWAVEAEGDVGVLRQLS